jgi:hypothetical protein
MSIKIAQIDVYVYIHIYLYIPHLGTELHVARTQTKYYRIYSHNEKKV